MKRRALKLMACLVCMAMLQSPLSVIAANTDPTTSTTSTTSTVSTISTDPTSSEGTTSDIEQEAPEDGVITGTVATPTIDDETGMVRIVVTPETVTAGIQSVEVATWDQAIGNEDDEDLVWHTAIDNGDGSYLAEFDPKVLLYPAGEYTAEAYITDMADQKLLVDTVDFTLGEDTTSGTTSTPTSEPTSAPTSEPTSAPTSAPTSVPTSEPTSTPTEDTTSEESLELAPMTTELAPEDMIAPVTVQPIEVWNVDSAAGTAKIVTTPGAPAGGVQAVFVPTWSAKGGQDDIIWYKAEKQSDGTYVWNFNASRHQYETGTYYSHMYIFDNAGNLNFIEAAEFTVGWAKSAATVDGNTSAGKRTIELSNAINQKGNKVQAAVWSNQGGHDDLHWIDMKLSGGKHTLTIDINQFKSAGEYTVHIYQFDSAGRPSFVDGTTFTVDNLVEATLAVNNVNDAKGTAQFVIKPGLVTGGIRAVQVPTWSDNGGQDDIIWHQATKQSDGSYVVNFNVANHGYDAGKYISHLYIINNFGQLVYVEAADFEMNIQPSTVSVQDVNGKETTYNIQLSNPINQKDEKVLVAVWSDKGGQDDLRWMEMNLGSNAYTKTINIADYKTTGTYHVHTYLQQRNGTMVFLDGTTFDVTGAPTGTVSVSNINGATGTFTATVSFDMTNCKAGISRVLIPIWSKPDRSDIKWYIGTKVSENTYTVNVNIRDHALAFGAYTVHTHVEMNNGITVAAGTGTATIEPTNYVRISTLGNGQYKISVQGVPANTAKVQFPTWSDANGTGDTVWYEAVKTATGFEAVIDVANHKDSGGYTTYMYYTDTNGTQTYAGVYRFNVAASDLVQAKIDEGVEVLLSKTGRDLYAAYMWIAKNLTYVTMNTHPAVPAGYTREQLYAINGFETFSGNCFVYASMFTQVARELGFEARYVEGRVTSISGGLTRHGWTEVKVDGAWYICDPNIQRRLTVSVYMQPINNPRLVYVRD